MESPVLAAFDLAPPITLFELDEHGSNNTMHGVHTGAGSFVLKAIEARVDHGRLRYEHSLLRWLRERELPFAVPLPVAARDGRTLVESDDYRYALFRLLPGRQPDENNTVQLSAFGAALGELHCVLAAYSRDIAPGLWRYDKLELAHPAIPDPHNLTPAAIGLPDEPANDELCGWWRGELAALQPFLAERYGRLPRQVIHGDWGLSNTLFVGDKLTAILDFEFALPDARAMDLASGVQFTLRPWRATPNWQQAQAFCSGYLSVVRLDAAEIEALPELVRLRNVVSGVWWLGRYLVNSTPERGIDRLQWILKCNEYIRRSQARLTAMLSVR